tara:strand:+ start:355 stop:1014 length:660 start_codon:yes stop_codon:yes gene_type:complete
MANTSTTGFGARMSLALGNTPATSGQSKYKIKSGLGKNIHSHAPVSLQYTSGGDASYIQDITHATMDDGLTGGASWDADASNVQPILGVFNGAFYIDNSTSKPTFANFVASGTTFATNNNTGNNDGIGFVNDNPFQEYIVRADAAVADSNIAGRCNLNNHGSHKNGTSIVTLDIQADNDGRAFRIIRSAEVPNQEDLAAAGADIVVVFNNRATLWTKDA